MTHLALRLTARSEKDHKDHRSEACHALRLTGRSEA
jgi:hypothetical protein